MRPDGSTVLAYTQEAVDALDPEKMFESIAGDMNAVSYTHLDGYKRQLHGSVEINHVGTTIGSHTGPGTVALFFWGSAF